MVSGGNVGVVFKWRSPPTAHSHATSVVQTVQPLNDIEHGWPRGGVLGQDPPAAEWQQTVSNATAVRCAMRSGDGPNQIAQLGGVGAVLGELDRADHCQVSALDDAHDARVVEGAFKRRVPERHRVQQATQRPHICGAGNVRVVRNVVQL